MTATAIEWTQRVWNPVAGCQIVSPGCTNCYAMKMAHRLAAMGQARYAGLTRVVNGKPVWTGEVRPVPEALLLPLTVRKPTTWFVNSMTDLFAGSMPLDYIEQVFAVMALTPHHTYQVLTKRPAAMAAFLNGLSPDEIEAGMPFDAGDGLRDAMVEGAAQRIYADRHPGEDPSLWLAVSFPLKNVILGCSVEDQVRADERRSPMAELADAGWATFVSYEPALGAVDWTGWEFLRGLISGGESGPGARPSHPDWHRAARDFCAHHGIPFFFKQWGAWAPRETWQPGRAMQLAVRRDGRMVPDDVAPQDVGGQRFVLVGKGKAGRILDGRTHDARPELIR